MIAMRDTDIKFKLQIPLPWEESSTSEYPDAMLTAGVAIKARQMPIRLEAVWFSKI